MVCFIFNTSLEVVARASKELQDTRDPFRTLYGPGKPKPHSPRTGQPSVWVRVTEV